MREAHEEAPRNISVGLPRRKQCLLTLFFELALDRVVALALARGRAGGLFAGLFTRAGGAVRLGFLLFLLVHELGDLLSGRAQLIHRGLDALRVVTLEGLA